MSSPLSIDLPADIQVRLDAAGVTDHATLMQALQADAALRADFESVVRIHQEQIFQATWHEFTSASHLDELRELAQQTPFILEDGFLAAVEQEIQRTVHAGQPLVADGLRQRLEGLHQLRQQVRTELPPVAQAVMDFVQAESDLEARAIFVARRDLLHTEEARRWIEEQFASDDEQIQQILLARRTLLSTLRAASTTDQPDTAFDQALSAYIGQRTTAAATDDLAIWQQAVATGETLLLPPLGDMPEFDRTALQHDLANAYNELGNLLDETGDALASLAAYERAIILQPDVAVWHRNRSGVLIELDRLEEAALSIAHARELDATANRLHELDAALARARAQSA